MAHVDLAPFGFAGCAVLSASYAEQMIYAGVPPAAFAVSFTGAVVGTTLLLTAPLLFFTPKLVDAKQRALLEYGTLAATYTRAFAAKWLPTDPPPDEPILGTPDLQSLADLGSSFDLIRQHDHHADREVPARVDRRIAPRFRSRHSSCWPSHSIS